MTMFSLSRRRFTLLTAAAATDHALSLSAQMLKGTTKPLAGDLASRIAAKSGVAPGDKTVDGFKAGDESMPVRGIAVAAMATVDVLRQASKLGLNMVITFEPTFFGRSDGRPPASPASPGAPSGRGLIAQDDPVLAAKRKLIESSGMVVYRFHDQWAGRTQNELASALGQTLGWGRFAKAGDPTSYEISAVALAELVPHVKTRVKANGGLRVVGDPAAKISRVAVLPGLQPLSTLIARMPAVDLIITGESRDWEGAEYAGDTVSAGVKKGLIAIGRVVSEDPGMQACAGWIKTFIQEVPVQWIATGDPFWRPV
jgi:putative NIF3 family GTP cyclohydrolase 1 type 2